MRLRWIPPIGTKPKRTKRQRRKKRQTQQFTLVQKKLKKMHRSYLAHQEKWKTKGKRTRMKQKTRYKSLAPYKHTKLWKHECEIKYTDDNHVHFDLRIADLDGTHGYYVDSDHMNSEDIQHVIDVAEKTRQFLLDNYDFAISKMKDIKAKQEAAEKAAEAAAKVAEALSVGPDDGSVLRGAVHATEIPKDPDWSYSE